MIKHPIATVVNFCTNESRFIKSCLEQALIFSKQVIVSVSTHFFDGTAENSSLLKEIYAAFPECQFVEYPFAPNQVSRKLMKSIGADHFWHCASRAVGMSLVRDEIETVLFLDADEIADGCRFQEWLHCSDYRQHVVLKLANHWYFREPCYQAESFEDSIVLVQKKALSLDLLLHSDERCALYSSLPNPKRRMVMGTDGWPLFHHFSWVRTKEEMLKKVRSWGHKKDRKWDELVVEEFSAPFQGKDFVHGYQFRTISPPFAISMSPPQFLPRGQERVHRLTEQELGDLLKIKGTSFWHTLFS